MDQLLAMRTFVRIAESGTFAKAADLLNLPRSTVSKLISDLEDHLDTKLIQRTTRSVTVTPDGAEYYERALRLLDELNDMDQQARRTKAQPQGKLRVDIGSLLANRILIPALPDFWQRYPDIEVYLGVNDRPVDLVGDAVDCVIRGGALSDSSLIGRRICQLDYVTCASPDYLAQRSGPLHPRELETGHQLVSYFSALSGKVFPLLFERGTERIEVSHSGVALNESTAHLSALLSGLGIGQTFRFAAQPYLDDGQLVPLLDDWTRDCHPLYVVYPSNRHLNAKLRVFIEWVAQTFARVDVRQMLGEQ
ncbi:LysR family transcriptional regulator [Kaistia dalseonensis]|uniref:DNA-binding transcriptional LysR family regulator n=1 Tax=Kaistia dalseonensis TaxID=410840 RepID=A0ABU0H7T4_9HYPH|nr:LysR family transcriptional regulator [Kaistia dalseonensis]MCX5495733.1 LysR family transcriptional regulator [Kaistia dalseonensis]MDQ0438330.1 DNA-binding transcriptional LysR family regulator [Kaistia dalseonensis]